MECGTLAHVFAVPGATLFRTPASKTMSWVQMASQDTQLNGLVKINKATKEVACARYEKLSPLLTNLLRMLHPLFSVRQPLTWRAPSSTVLSQPYLQVQVGARHIVT